MGNVQMAKNPSGKVFSSNKRPKTATVSSGSSAPSTAPTTPVGITDTVAVAHKKVVSINLKETSTNQPPGNRSIKMTDETPSQNVEQTGIFTQETYSKDEEQERRQAAVVLQKVYRGHRTRRQLAGFSLSPEDKWLDTVEQAKFNKFADPKAEHNQRQKAESSADGKRELSPGRQKWERAIYVAKMAQKDYSDESEDSEDSDAERETDSSNASGKLGDQKGRRKAKRKAQRDRNLQSKMMDLQYFLEMVDAKHRYGSNLRPYHEYWKEQDTKENFFYWLDIGAGKHVDLGVLPRTQLESERIKYLNREQRKMYLVKVDEEGRLCWAKNGKHINTYGKYVDTKNMGIVPLSEAPEDDSLLQSARPVNTGSSEDASSSSDDSGTSDSEEAERYVDAGPPKRGVKKIVHVSPATILNRLLRKTTKTNTWIFVADMNFRLYVGIKKSGTFQHSSFLHGARVAAAGLIKIRDGKLTSISPLSGHYRPPAANFRLFVKALSKEGVDMHHVRISKSYAVLVGLEAYGKLTRSKKKAEEHEPLKTAHKKKIKFDIKRIIDSKREDSIADDEASSSANKKPRGRRDSKGKREDVGSSPDGARSSSGQRPALGSRMKELFHHHSHSEEAAPAADQDITPQHSNRLGGFLRRHSKASTNDPRSSTTTTLVGSEHTTLEPTAVGWQKPDGRPDIPELAANMENLRVENEDQGVKQPQFNALGKPISQMVAADGNGDGGGARPYII